jgi:hypothetical protein
MALITFPQVAFNSGEVSPEFSARFDVRDYSQAARIVENLIIDPEGPARRRGGTKYIATAKASANHTMLDFEFSEDVTQAYAIEAGDRYFRFYRNRAQITVPNTNAAITNGAFTNNINDWDDRSTGGASISHTTLDFSVEGTFSKANNSAINWGDGVVNGLNAGFRFFNNNAGTVKSVRVETNLVASAMDGAKAYLYTDSSGSPGAQVGAGSSAVNLAAAFTIYTFSFPTPPTINALTNYWIVFADESGPPNIADVQFKTTFDQGAAHGSGVHDTITSITDSQAANDFRVEVQVLGADATGVLVLDGNGTDIAWAEQDVTTSQTNVEHVLRFAVFGIAGDTFDVRVGSSSLGDHFLDLTLGVGNHALAFTPTASPFYVQFRNRLNKRLFIDDVVLLDDEPFELVTPYLDEHLSTLQTAQSFDVMYIANGEAAGSAFHGYEVRRLERRGHTTWSLVRAQLKDGPYLPTNDNTAHTMTPAAVSGNGVTLTSSVDLFDERMQGRNVTITHGATRGYGVIVQVLSLTVALMDVKTAFGNTTASADWRLGVYSGAVGQPRSVAFHEQRLAFAGSDSAPGRIDLSAVAEFDNFSPGSADSDAISVIIDADKSPAVRWLASANGHLFVGSIGRLYSVEPDTVGGALTPSARIEAHAAAGAAYEEPVIAGSDLLYVQRHGRKLRAVEFDLARERFIARNRTRLCRHVTGQGISQLAFQQEPYPVLWAKRADGQLVGWTYEANEEPDGQPVIAASRHILAEAEQGTLAQVLGLTVIPGASGDELWLIVERTIDGDTVSHVEIVTDPFDPNTDTPSDAFYVDAGVSYSGPPINSITLPHLKNEVVWALVDGVKLGPITTNAAGVASLVSGRVKVQIGLKYTWRLQPMRPAPVGPAGATLGRVKQINSLDIDFMDTLDVKVGRDASSLDQVDLGSTTDPVTGFPDNAHPMDTALDKTSDFILQGDGVFPVGIRAIVMELETHEGTPA